MATGVQTLRRSSNPTGSLRVQQRPCTLWLPPDSALQLRSPLRRDLITVRVPASRNSPSPGHATRASAGMPPRIRQGAGRDPLGDVPATHTSGAPNPASSGGQKDHCPPCPSLHYIWPHFFRSLLGSLGMALFVRASQKLTTVWRQVAMMAKTDNKEGEAERGQMQQLPAEVGE